RYRYTTMSGSDSGKSVTLTLSYENGTLKGEFDPVDKYMGRFAMVRIAPDVFAPGLYDKRGEIYEVLRPDMMFTFARANGRPMTFEERGGDDELSARGMRLPN
ncbi:MAG: hypothetical protein ABIZ70_09445, partial [Gemmatimonadales bacterium]